LWDFSCGIRTDGTITCWGVDAHGQGNPPGGTNFQAVGTGNQFACALNTNGTVVCWGSDLDGRASPPGGTRYEPPNVSNISICSGPNAGEVVISWDAAPRATHYRIGYVNMVQDYPRAKASVTGEWIEAFIYVDVNALNVPVSNDGRAQYALRRLAQGDRHAFTVLTSDNVVNTAQTLSGTYYWPQNPRWQFLTVADPEPGCGVAVAAAAPTVQPGDYDGDNDGLVEISNLAQLDAIRHDLDGDGSATHPDHVAAFPSALVGMGCPATGCTGYELIADLDFDTNGSGQADAGDAYWNDGWGWTPIGDPDEAFRWNAAFDGNGHTISNLYIRWGDTDFVGLFRAAGSGSAVRNVGLEAVNVTGKSRVGGLVGDNRGAVSNCHTTGQVTGNGNYVGGLMGAGNRPVAGSHSTANVTGGGSDAGGLVGHIGEGGSIISSYAAGDVDGAGNNVGGLAGSIGNNVTVNASYVTGAVSGKNYVGGLIGNSSPGSAITASYATGNVTGRYSVRRFRTSANVRSVSNGENVGGLVGYSNETAITSSYARGSVNGGDTAVGGLVGSASAGTIATSYSAVGGASHYAAGGRLERRGVGLVGSTTDETSVIDSYWDTNLSGEAGPGGKTSRELQSPTANTGIYANWNPDWWDFGTSWQYPALKYGGMDVALQRS